MNQQLFFNIEPTLIIAAFRSYNKDGKFISTRFFDVSEKNSYYQYLGNPASAAKISSEESLLSSATSLCSLANLDSGLDLILLCIKKTKKIKFQSSKWFSLSNMTILIYQKFCSQNAEII